MNNKVVIWFLICLFTASVANATEAFVLSSNKYIHIRSLAASCAACHGTNGNSVDKTLTLAGMNKTEIQSKLLSFKSGDREATVMQKHAKGLNLQEIGDLAAYFSSQTPHKPTVLMPEDLQIDHVN